MSPLETLGFALGTSFASGLNVYATVAAAGLMQRLGVVQLPDSLQVLSHPIVLGVAITLFLVEFIADKIPYVDSAWDALHTFIRPPAAAVLSYSAFGNAAGGVQDRRRAPGRQCCADLPRGQGQRSRGSQYQPRAGKQLGAQHSGGWTGGVSGLDSSGASADHGRNRPGAPGYLRIADPEALAIRDADGRPSTEEISRNGGAADRSLVSFTPGAR